MLICDIHPAHTCAVQWPVMLKGPYNSQLRDFHEKGRALTLESNLLRFSYDLFALPFTFQAVTGPTFLTPYLLDPFVNGKRGISKATRFPQGILCFMDGVKYLEYNGLLKHGWWNMGVAFSPPPLVLLWAILFLVQWILSRFSKFLECTQDPWCRKRYCSCLR